MVEQDTMLTLLTGSNYTLEFMRIQYNDTLSEEENLSGSVRIHINKFNVSVQSRGRKRFNINIAKVINKIGYKQLYELDDVLHFFCDANILTSDSNHIVEYCLSFIASKNKLVILLSENIAPCDKDQVYSTQDRRYSICFFLHNFPNKYKSSTPTFQIV